MLTGDTIPHTIARRLVLLVAASVLPVLAFAGFVIFRLADAERTGYRMQALATARALSLAVDRDMASQEATVHALASSRELADGDLEAFHRRASQVLEGDTDRRIVLFDSTGQQIVNTYVPLGHKLPKSNFNWAIERVFATGAPASSNLIIGAANGKPTVGVYVPVKRDGVVQSVLAMGFSPGRIAQILREQRMPEGWIASIVDREGVILARNRAEELIGQPIPPNYLELIKRAPEAVGVATTTEGLSVQAAYVRSANTDWTTMVAVETAILEAPLRRSLLWLAGGGALLLVAASCASMLYVRRIARPVVELTRMADALGRGEPLGERRLGLPEAQVIADQLRSAGELLEQRNKEREGLLAGLEERVTARTRELSESEVRYREAAGRAEAASQAKSRFLAGMSHELRTPLSIVIGFSDILLDSKSDPLTEHQRDFLGHIRLAGRQLLGLINDVLDLAKIESGRLQVTIERVELRDAIDTCVAMLRPMAEEKGIGLEVRPWRVQAPAIRADRARLVQVLLNLGSNAIKYNRPGGVVIFDVGRSRSGRIRITTSDTGSGIAADRQHEMFELFNRLGAENSGVEGTGIGLAICKRLVDLMRGHIGFTSDPGWGSSFWVEFPADRSAPPDTIERTPAVTSAIEAVAPADASEAAAAPAKVHTRTVLHIDDNPAALALLRQLYRSASNVRVVTASTGEQGVALAIEHRPDVVVTDIRLPDISGYEVLRRLRSMPETRDIPVLALSAEATKGDVARGRDSGFAHYMTKPFAIDELLAAIQRAMEKKVA